MKRRIALTLASGLIGGAALGCGIVLFLAITSDRLRRRFDVAAALEVPVPVSVGRIALSRRWLWFPHVRALTRAVADERQRLAHAIEMELPSTGTVGPARGGVHRQRGRGPLSLATAAMSLAADGRGSFAVIDLTEHGALSRSPGADARPRRSIGPPCCVHEGYRRSPPSCRPPRRRA